MTRLLSIDLEDWFHLLNDPALNNISQWSSFERRVEYSTAQILDILQKYGINNVVFYVLGWIAKEYPDLVKRIYNMGYTIGSHSMYHQLAHEQGCEEFFHDTETSKLTIENIIDDPVIHYRAPGFSFSEKNLSHIECLVELGFKTDSSIFVGRRFHGGVSQIPFEGPFKINTDSGALIELPLHSKATPMLLSHLGGGYFRLLPLWLIKKLDVANEFNYYYFHPRDFDYHQPRLKHLSTGRYLRTYLGLKGALLKFEHFLHDNCFDRINDVVRKEMVLQEVHLKNLCDLKHE